MILGAGDGDYVPVVNDVKNAGAKTWLLSTDNQVSRDLVTAVGGQVLHIPKTKPVYDASEFRRTQKTLLVLQEAKSVRDVQAIMNQLSTFESDGIRGLIKTSATIINQTVADGNRCSIRHMVNWMMYPQNYGQTGFPVWADVWGTMAVNNILHEMVERGVLIKDTGAPDEVNHHTLNYEHPLVRWALAEEAVA